MIAMLWKCERYGVSDKPIAVEITAFYLVPKSWSKKKQAATYAGEIKPTVKPDIDNIVKIVLDGLNGVAFTDDKQVIEIQAQKCYVFDDEQEGVYVDVKEL
jgi:Holliday junction resolvase RusA-like endonuclease